MRILMIAAAAGLAFGAPVMAPTAMVGVALAQDLTLQQQVAALVAAGDSAGLAALVDANKDNATVVEQIAENAATAAQAEAAAGNTNALSVVNVTTAVVSGAPALAPTIVPAIVEAAPTEASDIVQAAVDAASSPVTFTPTTPTVTTPTTEPDDTTTTDDTTTPPTTTPTTDTGASNTNTGEAANQNVGVVEALGNQDNPDDLAQQIVIAPPPPPGTPIIPDVVEPIPSQNGDSPV